MGGILIQVRDQARVGCLCQQDRKLAARRSGFGKYGKTEIPKPRDRSPIPPILIDCSEKFQNFLYDMFFNLRGTG